MDITENARALIERGLEAKGIRRTQLADLMGRGKAWATKLLDGTLKHLSDSDVDRIEELLGISFYVATPTARVSSLAAELSKAADSDPELSQVLVALLAMKKGSLAAPAKVSAPEQTRIGREITRIALLHHDNPAKVCREVLKLLSE